MRKTAHRLNRKRTRTMLDTIFDDAHAKRLDSLANYTVGAMAAGRAGIHAIGAAYAAIAEIQPRSAVKQVDRYLSNTGIDVEAMTASWVAFVLGPREEALVALDWTEFDEDDHATLAAYLLTSHGRATPLAWKTVSKKTLKNKRTGYEQALVERLSRAIPAHVGVTLLADRGFGDQTLYRALELLGWDFVIRFRGNIVVEHGDASKPAKQWVPDTGRATRMKNAQVTKDRTKVGAVVVVHNKRMREPWCLATSLGTASAANVVKLYGRRFTIEETFRDQKDLRFGLGLRATHISSAARRDRLLMLLAIAQALLTLLGAAAEQAGLDKYLKTNTVKRRTHSLFRQGSYWYSAIPHHRDDWISRLMREFDDVLRQHQQMAEILSII